MSPLRLEELVSYFVYAQPKTCALYDELDFVRLIEDLGLDTANHLRHEIVRQLAEGHPLPVIQAGLAA